MENRKKQGSGRNAPPAKHKGNGKGSSRGRATKDAIPSGDEKLMERLRQIISETPEIRPEKVGPLREAVEQGTYSVDVRKLANILITRLFLDS